MHSSLGSLVLPRCSLRLEKRSAKGFLLPPKRPSLAVLVELFTRSSAGDEHRPAQRRYKLNLGGPG